MSDATETRHKPRAILADAEREEAFAAIADPENGAGREVLRRIADKIGRTRRPGALSDIPAGATYLAQFAVHDLDLRGREDVSGAPRLDLALIYGDGPRHDAFAYQAPDGPGDPRRMLRMGRTRPTGDSPAWGAARDLPRVGCPHLDAHGVDARSEVLIPNAFSDSNLLLGQMQTIWAMLHNLVVQRLAETRADDREVFETARRITRQVYRDALIRDVLGSWLLPKLRGRYVKPEPERLSSAPLAAMPRAFLSGVARLGHGLVREVYEINDRRTFEGLRSLVRHTGAGRPGDMPLTEDWLVDFARFFDLDDRKAQRARGLGPHVARPFALGGGVGLDAPTPSDGLVLRDLIACTRVDPSTQGRMPNVRTLARRIDAAAPGLLEGCFAQDEGRWSRTVADWLADLDLDPHTAATLAQDPPLTLFLMLEAEADAGGAALGALGSILLAETVTGALPDAATPEDLGAAREVFQGAIPSRTAEVIVALQRYYQFAEGARLHPAERDRKEPTTRSSNRTLEATMLDNQNPTTPGAGLVEVADYIELGRLVVDWTRNADCRPGCIADLVTQLDGIAKVPDTFKAVQFVEGKSDVLVIRLPEKGVTDQTLATVESLLVGEPYMLPKFYDDIYHKHFGPVMSPLDVFLARVGDYTIAQCK
ncbi:MAG: hypothetical protein H0T41_01185 [Rhodobacteraceae bacterium]|nr:hypothetical protein [Paracoccaceae bacterium]